MEILVNILMLVTIVFYAFTSWCMFRLVKLEWKEEEEEEEENEKSVH